jgi:streptogramin lyase
MRNFRVLSILSPKKIAIYITSGALFVLPLLNAGLTSADPTINEYPIPTTNASPYNLAQGPDGNMWFTEQGASQIGEIDPSGTITEYPIPAGDNSNPNETRSFPFGIAQGPDGNMWFTELTPSGGVTLYHATTNSYPNYITQGSDGNMWFTENQGNNIGRIDMSGTITEYPIPTAHSDPEAITNGPEQGSNNKVWFVESNADQIGSIDQNGTITEYPLPGGSDYRPDGITAGPDGNLWFTDVSENGGPEQIGSMTESGNVSIYQLPSVDNAPFTIVSGSDGNLWFTNDGNSVIGRISSTTGQVTNYATPTQNSSLTGIAQNSDNTIWFAENAGNYIGSIVEPEAGPTNLSAASPTLIPTLNWGTPPTNDAQSYNIYRDDVLIGTTTANTYIDNGAPTGEHNYYVTDTTTHGESDPSNTVTVYVVSSPAITSSSTTSANVNSPFNFQITSSGTPTPTVTENGALPSGISFTNNYDGTATLSGTPAFGTTGNYPIIITANNGDGYPATQSITLSVTANNVAPTFVSASSDTETYGVPFRFTVQTSGNPAATITKSSGSLPKDITVTDNGDGTATIAGDPELGSDMGVYNITLKAKNSAGTITQNFSLTLQKAPVMNPISNKKTSVGQPFSMTIKAKGYYTPIIGTSPRSLPKGLTFTDNGDGTATIAGTTQPGSGGAYTIRVGASNALGGVVQTFIITVDEPPSFYTPDNATATVGEQFDYGPTSNGYPNPVYKESGKIPKGIIFGNNGAADFDGVPAKNTQGTYTITITAKNSSGSAQQVFTLTVD